MKSVSTCSFLLVLLLMSCSKVSWYEFDDEEEGLYSKVYMPLAERGTKDPITISPGSEPLEFEYSAYLGGPHSASGDLKLVFGVENDKVGEFNSANKTHYKLLPSEAYEFTSETMIKSGERSSPTLYLSIFPKIDMDWEETTYILPISIVSANGAQVNEIYGTAYFLFKLTYGKIFFPLAKEYVDPIVLNSEESTRSFTYSAYLDGPVDPENDLTVFFDIDPDKVTEYNNTYGTHYTLLPASAYELKGEATLGAESRTTGDITVDFKPDSPDLQDGAVYVLPIKIKDTEGGAKINDELSTLSLVVPFYDPNTPISEKVLDLGSNWDIISAGPRKSIYIRQTGTWDIIVYEINPDGTFMSPRVVGPFWDLTESLYYVSENSMLARNEPYWAGLFTFDVDNDLVMIPRDPWEVFWMGDFWDRFVIVPYKNFLLTIDDKGEMWRQPVFTHVDSPKEMVAMGFNGFVKVEAFKDYLLALANNGKLWLYPMSSQAEPGMRIQVGTGWAKFVNFVVTGEDVLGVDSNGSIHRFSNFDPNSYYALP